MKVNELIKALTDLGPEAGELPVVYVEEVWAVTVDELQIVDTDEEGAASSTSPCYFRRTEYPSQKVVVL